MPTASAKNARNYSLSDERLPELFQPYASSTTAIIILEKGVPHPPKAPTFFCRITNDGYTLRKNVRVEQAGEQLTIAAAAFRDHSSVPGFCISTPPTEGDWSPGAYISNPSRTEETVRSEIDGLIRAQVAFHARFADRLFDVAAAVERGVFAPLPYGQITEKGAVTSPEPDRLGSLFKIYYGQQELENKKDLPPGEMPVISSAGTDNGCYGFYSFGHIAPLVKPPFVTAPRTGSIGEAFVQLYPCGVTSDCMILVPNRETKLEDLYIAAAIIRLERWRFDYSRKITPSRLAAIRTNADESLRKWTRSRLAIANPFMASAIESLSHGGLSKEPTKEIRERFKLLASSWADDADSLSSATRMASHPAYLEIMGMGQAAIPLLLSEL